MNFVLLARRFEKCMIQNIYLYFSKARDANLRRWALNGWRLFKNACGRTKPSPGMQLERLFSWISYEMWVDKYENINIERIYSILLYELTHLICWLKAYSAKLLCVTCLGARACARAPVEPLMHSAERASGSLRKHSGTSRLHKHSCITQIRCSRACRTTPTRAPIASRQNSCVLLERKCIKL